MSYKTLERMENTSVLVTTVEERDWLFEQYDRVGWVWRSGDRPKEFTNFSLPAYIDVNSPFVFWQIEYAGDTDGCEHFTIEELKELLKQ